MAQFWYDQQIRRYLLQFVRIFNGFQVKSGQKDAGGTASQVYRTVPMRYACLLYTSPSPRDDV